MSNLLAALYTVDLIPIDKFPRHDSCRDMTHVEVFFFIFLFHRWRAEVTPSDLGWPRMNLQEDLQKNKPHIITDGDENPSFTTWAKFVIIT